MPFSDSKMEGDVAFRNRLGGHSNSYHTYSLEEALEGIAAAGYKFVELSAVRGWTEHVPLEADAKTLGRIQRMMNKLGLISLSLSGHSDLTTKDGLKDGLKAVDLCERMGIEIMNTAIGGHYSESEDEDAFMGNIHELADYAAARDILLGIEIHGESQSRPWRPSRSCSASTARTFLSITTPQTPSSTVASIPSPI
jgi:L-ribulose-5-phosphate 3-epimerase